MEWLMGKGQLAEGGAAAACAWTAESARLFAWNRQRVGVFQDVHLLCMHDACTHMRAPIASVHPKQPLQTLCTPTWR